MSHVCAHVVYAVGLPGDEPIARGVESHLLDLFTRLVTLASDGHLTEFLFPEIPGTGRELLPGELERVAYFERRLTALEQARGSPRRRCVDG